MIKSLNHIILLLALTLVSCQGFVSEIADMHIKLLELQADVDRINVTTASLADIVSSMDDDYIVKIEDIIDGGEIIGYYIIYKNGNTVRVYNGIDGKKGEKGDDGHNGRDGHCPLISIRKASDGLWYWTVDGQWMTDGSGERIPVAGQSGITPRLKVENGRWQISYDGGISWQDYGEASTSFGSSPILDVDYSTYIDKVKFILCDGTEFFVYKDGAEISLSCSTPSVIEIHPGEQAVIGFKISNGTSGPLQVDVMAGDMFKWKTAVVGKDSCTVSFRADDRTSKDDLFTVFISCERKTWMKVFTVNLLDPEESVDLSDNGTANCYMVSRKGKYSFQCEVKGGSDESVGRVSSAEVLWETFGTSVKPEVGDVVSDVYYFDGKIFFTSGKDGNAVIAAKSSSGEILWSWHIWVCEGFYPDETAQEYYHNAGTMMDRNLGALSAIPGAIEAFGLHYQWGRKDPFPGPQNANSNEYAITTLGKWETVNSTAQSGTIAYSIAHPTSYLVCADGNQGWLYSPNQRLWQTEKTTYDPCPPGWRVPDGGTSGVWAKAFNSSALEKETVKGDFSKGGMDFGSGSNRPIGNYPHIWYPVSGTKDRNTSNIYKVSTYGGYWSCTSMNSTYSYSFYFDLYWAGQGSSSLQIIGSTDNAYSHPVRCQAINVQ